MFTGTLVLCAALRGLSFLISKWDLMFRFLIAVTLGCLPYFSTDFKIVFAIFSAKGFVSLNPAIFEFFTAFGKNEFSSSAALMYWVKILSSSSIAIFSFDLIYSLPEFFIFLSATSFSFRFV